MNKVDFDLNKIEDEQLERFERELRITNNLEKYYREQRFRRTTPPATFFMRELVAGLENKRADALGNEAARSMN